MKRNIIFGLSVLLLILMPGWKAFAIDVCSNNGYTILTINGIWTDKIGAQNNKDELSRYLSKHFNNQPLKVDYLYNASHLAGLSDLVDVVAQKLFYETSDYDLTNMVNDASNKVTTEKVLLVSHSQGNFYANDLYDIFTSPAGSVPSKSIGVYGVASPSSRVAGGGKYITSNNDKIINLVRAKGYVNVLSPNTTIVSEDMNDKFGGHNFINVYLKYKSDRIVSDIKESLNKLKDNDKQDEFSRCIKPAKITFIHKVKSVAFAVADPTAIGIKYIAVATKDGVVIVAKGIYKGTVYVLNGIQHTAYAMGNAVSHLFANVLSGFSENEIPSGTIVDNTNNPPAVENIPQDPEILIVREDQYPPIDEILEEEANEVVTTEENTEPVVTQSVGRGPGGQNRTGQSGNSGGGGTSDTVAPVVTLSGVNPMDVVKGTTFSDPGATALDAVDGITSVTTTGTVDMTTIGTYTLTYTSTDAAGNVATATRTVNVIADTVAPVITLNGNAREVVALNSTYVDQGATATDNVDGSVTVVTTGSVNTLVAGIYTLTYTAIDTAGNSATKTRTVKVDSGAKLDDPKFVYISGSYAYVVSSTSNSLEIIDISNPGTLVHKGSIVHGDGGAALYDPKSVYVSGNYAFVLSSAGKVEVIDISNPSFPTHKVTFSSGDDSSVFNNPSLMTVSNNYMFIVARGSSNIEILDISNPEQIRHVSSFIFNPLLSVNGVFVLGNYLYYTYSSIATSTGGLAIVDISNINLPLGVSFVEDGTGGVVLYSPSFVYVSGGYAYIGSARYGEIEVIDVSNPNSPVHKSVIKSGDGNAYLYYPTHSAVYQNYLYTLLYYGSAVEVVDISDPNLLVSKIILPNKVFQSSIYYPTSIYVSGNYAYITSSFDDSLQVLDISNPLNPIGAGKIFNGEFNHTTTSGTYSSEKKILSFNFTHLTPNVVGVIDDVNHTVSLSVPNGTNVTSIAPDITTSANAGLVPAIGQAKNFTNPVTYKVYAEDGTTVDYVVTVTILPDTTSPSVSSYTFNGSAASPTVNPSVSSPLVINMTASENVNWMSIKIENDSDNTLYKMFMSDSSACVDGTNTCAKSWDGTLSSGGLLQSGTYKIKLHIKDAANNEFYDYLTPYVINVDTTI